MGLLSLFSKKSSTTNQTTNTFTDQSANAAEGSIAAGAGATVNIENLSDDVTIASLNTQRDTASTALFTQAMTSQGGFDLAARTLDANRVTAAMALTTNRDVTLASLDTTSNLARSAIKSVQSIGEVASRDRQEVLQTTQTALQSQAGITDKLAALASGALERSQTPDSQITKTLLYVVGAVAVVVLLFAMKGRRA